MDLLARAAAENMEPSPVALRGGYDKRKEERFKYAHNTA